MKILVSGSRNMTNYKLMCRVLDKHGPTTIIQGGARGADHLAKLYAQEKRLIYRTYSARWRAEGKRAGPIRNQKMLDDESPDLVIAFPAKNSIGTQDMIRRARHMGFSVEEHLLSDNDCKIGKR